MLQACKFYHFISRNLSNFTFPRLNECGTCERRRKRSYKITKATKRRKVRGNISIDLQRFLSQLQLPVDYLHTKIGETSRKLESLELLNDHNPVSNCFIHLVETNDLIVVRVRCIPLPPTTTPYSLHKIL